MRHQPEEEGEVGGRRRIPRGNKHRKHPEGDGEGSLTMQEQLLSLYSPAEPETFELPEINMSTNPDPSHQGDAPGGVSLSGNKKVTPLMDAPHGTVTRTAGDFTIVTPLRAEERAAFLEEARLQAESERSRDKYIKVASVGSTVLSFVALGLLLLGGFAAIRRSAQGDE